MTEKWWRAIFFLTLLLMAAATVLLVMQRSEPAVASINPDENPVVAMDQPVTEDDSSSHVRSILTYINNERALRNLALLSVQPALVEAARSASAASAQVGEPRHIADVVRLAEAAGYYHDGMREYQLATATESAESVFRRWWIDPEMQAVLLSQDFSDIGLARTRNPNGRSFYVLLIADEKAYIAPGAEAYGPGESGQASQEIAIVELLNAARQAQGMGTLRINPVLTSVALAHSQDQAARDLMTHDGSDGQRVDGRVSRVGYIWQGVGENVLVRPNVHAGGAFDQWWTSPPHYEAMMNSELREIGIAYAHSATGQVYYTMVLATPQE